MESKDTGIFEWVAERAMGKHTSKKVRGGARIPVKKKAVAWDAALVSAKALRNKTLWSRFEGIFQQVAALSAEAAASPWKAPELSPEEAAGLQLVGEAEWMEAVKASEEQMRGVLMDESADMLLQLPRGWLQVVSATMSEISCPSLMCACVLYLRWRWRGAAAGVKRPLPRRDPKMPDVAVFVLLCFISSKQNDIYCVDIRVIAGMMKGICPSQVRDKEDVKAKEMEMLQALGWSTHVSEGVLKETMRIAVGFARQPAHEQGPRRNEAIRLAV